MASSTYSLSSHGSNQHYQQQLLHTKNKAERKSATAKPAQSQTSCSAASSTDTDEDTNESDSSANEASNDEDHETNLIALSGAQTHTANSDQRLAGLKIGDVNTEDLAQTVGGASANDQDDEYAGIDEVSDDDEVEDMNERSIQRAAEKDLINEFEREQQRGDAAIMADDLDGMFLQDNESTAMDFTFDVDIDMNNDPFAGLKFGDGLYQEMYQDAEQVYDVWLQTSEERSRGNSEDSTGSIKRVRFAEPQETVSRSSSMSSSEDPTELFPDLLDAQNDPALRHRFGLDVDLDAAFHADHDDTGSCYDFDGEEERMALAIDDESGSDTDLSSYDSDTEDEGETTEEEEDISPPASARAAPKRASMSTKSTPSTPIASKRPSFSTPRSSVSLGTSTSGRGPKMGTFVIDKTKAAVSKDASGRIFNIVPPRNPTAETKDFWDRAKKILANRTGNARSTTYHAMRASATRNVKPRPLTAHSTLGTMFDGNLDILNQAPDFASHFNKELLLQSLSSFTGSFDRYGEEQPSDINMNDFIDLDDDGSDTEEAEPESASSIMSLNSELFDSVSSLDAHRNDSLLDHLDQQRGLVGAFRHNQTFAKTLSSMASHPAERASTSEANALQKGRRAAGNTPMTPARKNRVSQDMSSTGAGIRKIASSPLVGRRPRSRGGSMANLSQTLGPAYM